MKKFIPLGIAAMGIVGFLGIGATAASATTPGPDQTAVCNAINAAINNQATPTANAEAAETAATTALTNATTTLNTAMGAFVSTVSTWILDTDAHSPNVNVDQVAFQNAANNFVAAITGWSNAQAAKATADHNLAVILLQNQILAAIKGGPLAC